MMRQFYLSLLIICAILSQGMFVLSDENIDESSDLLIRKKRVIDKMQNGEMPVLLKRSPYIVNILKDGFSHCAGIILDHDIVLSVSPCITALASHVTFSILSGSPMRNHGIHHNITNRMAFSKSNLAMFKIVPPIEFHQLGNNKIELFTGYIPPFASAWFTGWGCTNVGPGTPPKFPEKLVITHLPLISQEECAEIRGHQVHELRYICTRDTSKRRATCMGDEGGPLVYKKRLIGVLLHRTRDIGKIPDVFVNLMEHDEHNWVISSMNSLQN